MNTTYLLRGKWFFYFCLLLVNINLSAQEVYLSLSGQMDCSNDNYCLSINLKAGSGTFEIGTSSIFLDYREEALQFESYTSSSFDGTDLCIADVAAAWDKHSFDGVSVAGDFNLTMTLLSNTFSCPSVGEQFIEVGTVCFNVLDNTLDPEILISRSNTQFNSASSNDGTNARTVGLLEGISGPSAFVCDPCIDQGGDTDSDTVCDVDDVCPTGDDRLDADNDGIPDACDTCDTTLVGQTCDDFNECTTGDVYDASCNCAGVFVDADSDGVCDAEDVCPTGDDHLDTDNDGVPDACDTCDATLAGQTCTDNNQCTTGDIYDADCNCAGILADADSDGVCDAEDVCPTGDDNLDADGDGIPDACDVVQQSAITGIIINEIHYNPSAGTDAEFIELVNTTNAPIQLQGFSFAAGVTYAFTQPFLLPGNGSYPQNYIILARDSIIFIDTYGVTPYGDYGGKLSNSGELVQLVDAANNILDEVTYQIIAPWDTIPNGGPYSLALLDLALDNSQAANWEAQPTLVTPGAVNVFEQLANGDIDGDGIPDNEDQCPGLDDSMIGTACEDGDLCTMGETYDASCNCVNGSIVDSNNDNICDFEQTDYSGLVINEIHYNPVVGDDGEFIEIVNTSPTSINLLGVRFSEGVDFVFEKPVLLSGTGNYPQNYLVIPKDSTSFPSLYSASYYGQYSGKLSNGGEQISLVDPLGNLIDEVIYADGLPWDSIPDNGVHSLALKDLSFDNSLPTSWSAQGSAIYTPGTVNEFEPINCSDIDNDGICDENDDCDNTKEGTACDDNNACTTGEVYDGNCNCIGGVFLDSDNDTVCDQEDQCPNLDDRLLGTACDDGNPNTGGDIYDLATCSCAGVAGNTTITQTTCKSISDSYDDVEENTTDGVVDFNSSDIELIYNRDYNQIIGLRFGNNEVPQGATIINATVLFTTDEVTSDPVNLVIKGEATDDAASFAVTPYNVSTRTTTNNSVNWSPQPWLNEGDAGFAQTTTDIASIIQEIVNRPNYQSGNAIALLIEGTGKRIAESYEGSPSQAAALCITYSIENTESICTAGASCDDGDPCTLDDFYDADCNCISDSLSPDSDNDGICDASDTTVGSCTAGASCDDGDPCTLDDFYDADCNCISDSLSPDSDNDGICDASDTTVGSCTAGASCDDGDPCTLEDYYDANCNCISDAISPDSDGDGICDANDTTVGNCIEGAACDDGDPCTLEDYYDAQCNCISDAISPDSDNDGICDASDTDSEETGCDIEINISDYTINITGLDDPIVSVKIYDQNFKRVAECDTWSTPCLTNEIFSDLPEGVYYIGIGTFDDNWNEVCNIFEEIKLPFDSSTESAPDADGDGIPDTEDCQPNNTFYPTSPGTSCDDLNVATSNDVVQEDGCSCEGVVIDDTCNATYSIDGNNITVNGLNNDIVSVKIFNSQWHTVFECDNWLSACSTTEIINNLPDGDYFISVGTFTSNWVRLCYVFEPISLRTGSISNDDLDGDGVLNIVDCEPNDARLPAPMGTSCDDLNSSTINDVIQEDGCTCLGVEPVDAACGNLAISQSDTEVIVSGLDGAPISTVHIYTDEWDLIYSCAGDCQETEINTLPADTYFVYARYYDTSWGTLCSIDETITINQNQGLRMSSSRSKNADAFQPKEAYSTDINVYPNPASSNTNVFVDFQSYAGQKGRIQVYNNLGQLIASQLMDSLPSDPFLLDLNNADAGLHTVSLHLEGGTTVSKMLVIK